MRWKPGAFIDIHTAGLDDVLDRLTAGPTR